MSGNPKNKLGRSVLVREGRADYEKLDSAAFPTLQTQDAGAILEVTDTGDRHRWSGTSWIQIATGGRVLTTDFYTEASLGNAKGASVVHIYGLNSDIDTASGFETVWSGGGDYTGHDATAAETLEVFSSSANDTGTILSSGTATGGSRTTLIDTAATFVTDGVAINDIVLNDTQLDLGVVTAVTETQITLLITEGLVVNASGDAYRIVTAGSTGTAAVNLELLLDGNLANETNEYIVLNGTTPVDTVGTYRRHSRVKAFGAGANVGTITVRQKTTTANITALVPIGTNASLSSIYTVPSDKQAFLVSWFTSLAKKQTASSSVRLMNRPPNCTPTILEELTISSTGTSAIQRDYRAPKNSLSPGTDIKIMADTDTNNSGVSAGFELLLIDI